MIDLELTERVVQTVRAAAKYAPIDEGLVRALAEAELAKGRREKEAVKAVRNKLHQIGSAYQEQPIDYTQLKIELDTLSHELNSPELRSFCLKSMNLHTSTRERLGFLEVFYNETLAGLGPIHSLLDLACGLNPLALPWLPLTGDARIEACDIYADMAEFLNAFFSHAGLDGRAFTCDLIHQIPDRPVQLALLLKTIPCLEQVDKTIGRRLLTGIQAEHMLVSFPVHSLAGRGKGMRQNYDRHFKELVAGLPWKVVQFDFPGELVYRLSRP